MARLAAIEKGLYFPTPARVMDIIAKAVTFTTPPTRILDICAGEGSALSQLAAAWGVQESFGVELDVDRAAAAGRKLTVCLQGSYHQLDTGPQFQVLFLNPPYDTGEKDGVSSRQEVQFLMDATEWLQPGGLLIFIPPRHILGLKVFQEYMRRHYRNIETWAFPSPEVDAFNQVVIFAARAGGSSYYSYGDISSLEAATLAPLDEGTVYNPAFRLPSPVTPAAPFELKGIDPLSIKPSWQDWGYASKQWDILMGVRESLATRPLVAPRPGHQAMLLAAGALDGAELVNGQLVKGGSEKIKETFEEGGEDAVVTIERERIVSRLSVLDLVTGDYETWRADEEPDRTAQWFDTHGENLARAIENAYTPTFNGDLTPYEKTLSGLTAPGILPGRTKPELLPQQQEAAAATAFWWGKGKAKTVVLSGEMGVGKTSMAVIASALARFERTVVMCPSHLVPKWIRECEKITGQKGVAVTAKQLSEVDAFFAEPDDGQEDIPAGPEGDDLIDLIVQCFGSATPPTVAPTPRPRFLVLSKEMAKLGARWEPCFKTRTVIVEEEVNDYEADRGSYWNRYSAPIPKKKVRSKRTVASCPDCGTVLETTPDNKVQQRCPKCKSALWQTVAISAKGTKRWPLARYINKRYKRQYALVIDECFPGETLISTTRGDVPIKDVRVGDMVWSRTGDGRVVARRVVRHIPKRRNQPLVRVTHEYGTLICTPDHKFWTTESGYVGASCLTSMSTLVQYIGGASDADKSVPHLWSGLRVCPTYSSGAEGVQPKVWCTTSTTYGASQPEENPTCDGDLRVVRHPRGSEVREAQTKVLWAKLHPTSLLVPGPDTS